LAVDLAQFDDIVLEQLGHVEIDLLFGDTGLDFFVGVRFGFPAEDFVHFEEDARVAVGESVAVGFSAVGHDRDLEITRFGRFGPGRVIAHVVGRFSRVLVSCKMPLNLIEFHEISLNFIEFYTCEEVVDVLFPEFQVLSVVFVEFEEEDVGVGVHGSESHTRVVADETVLLRPLGPVSFQRFEEDEHQEAEETGQERVEYHVEHQNLEPTLGCTSEHFLGAGVVEELLESCLWRRTR